MSQTFMQFQRQLREKGITDNNAYMFTLVYERLIEMEKQLTMAAKIIDEMANTMQGFVQLNETQQRDLRTFMRGGRPEGVEVYTESVLDEPKKN